MKIHMKVIGLVVVACFIAVNCGNEESEFTTGMISGLITDNNGSPVDSAVVTTIPQTMEVYTNDSGAFQIPDVSPDDYTVNAQKRTYIPGLVIVTVTAGDIITADISLTQNIRNVLGEMLTTACHCSDDARAEVYSVNNNNGLRFVYVEYHASVDPHFETWDPFATPGSESRRLYYEADTFMLGNWLFLDGIVLLTTTGNYQQIVDSLLGIFSSLAITISGTYASSTGSGTIDLEITAVDTIEYTDLVIEFAVYDRGPIDYSPSGPCLVMFENIVVALPTHEQLDIAYGETVNIVKDFTVPDSIGGAFPPFHMVNHNNLGIAVFVQSAGSKNILQAVSYAF